MAVGDANSPVRVDPVGTTTQPTSIVGPLGQAAMATSIPVAIASNQSAIPISDNGSSITVDGTVAATQSGSPWNFSLQQINGATTLAGNGVTGTGSQRVTIASDNTPFTVNAAQSGAWTVQPGNTANTTPWLVAGNKTSNAAAANGNNIGVLPAVATPATPTYTGGNQVALSTDLSGQLRVTASTTGSEEATYTVMAAAATPGNNKSMLSIYNPTGSGYVLKLREFYIRNAATTAVTGVAGKFELYRFASGSAPTGGSTVTVLSHDSNDANPASMDARTGGTISGEIATPLDIIRMSTDEWGPGTLDQEGAQQTISNYLPARAKRDGLIKPFFARPGEGLHLKFATNSTAGSLDIIFVFTKV